MMKTNLSTISEQNQPGPPSLSLAPTDPATIDKSCTNEILQAIDAEIQRLQQARALLVEGSGNGIPKAGKPGRRFSAAARARIVAAQTARWAKPGLKFSEEGRRRIVAGQKARWAKFRKAAK